jgi:hypothetical protein
MANYQSSNYGIFIEIYYPHLAIIKLSNRKSISIHVRARHWRVPWSVHQHWPPQPSTLQWRPSMLWRRYPSWSYEWMSVPEEAVFTTHLKPKDITVVGIFKHIWLYRLYHMITLYIYIDFILWEYDVSMSLLVTGQGPAHLPKKHGWHLDHPWSKLSTLSLLNSEAG